MVISGEDRQRCAQLMAQYPQHLGPEIDQAGQLLVLFHHLPGAGAHFLLQFRVDFPQAFHQGAVVDFQLSPGNGRIHIEQELIHVVNRFHQEIGNIETLPGGQRLGQIAMSGQDDKRRIDRVAADFFQQGEAVHAGHFQVGDDQVVVHAGEHLISGLPVFSRGDFMVQRFDHPGQHDTDRNLIIHYQYFCHGQTPVPAKGKPYRKLPGNPLNLERIP